LNKDLAMYLNDTFKLASTLTIKSQDSIDRINELLILQYGNSAVDPYAPSTWKYYLNICGEHHFTNEKMYVVSIDTLEEIEFTKANLKLHTDTNELYQYGTDYYYRLLEKYPDQEQLILGILYPANMDIAINADDGSILAYDKSLVEDHEESLLIELDDWIKRYLVRWHVRAFGHSDSLYATAQHAQLYLHLVPRLLNLRLKRCKTPEAHTFHIKNYLASHGRLDRFLPYMTLKQKLFFYRNINYIERNVGKMDTFYWLIEKLLSDRKIPIAEFSARYLGSFDPEHNPNYQFRKKPLNTPYNVPEKDYFNLEEVLDKEHKMAPGNLAYARDKYIDINTKFHNSLSHVVQTKDLESSMIDYDESVPHPLREVIMSHWAYLSAKKIFTAAVYFIDPRTGQQRVLMSDTAYLYMLFITLKQINLVPTTIPPILVQRIRRLVKPDVSELNSVAEKRYLSDKTIAQKILDNQPEIIPTKSRSAFFNLAEKIYTASLEEWFLTSNTHHVIERGYLDGMVNKLYFDGWVEFADTGKNYYDWLTELGIEDIDYTEEEVHQILSDIYKAATGHVVDSTKLLKNIQAAMLAMLDQLSSYSIQLIRNINEIPVTPLAWPAIRVGRVPLDGSGSMDNNQSHIILVPINNEIIEYETTITRQLTLDIKPYSLTNVAQSKQLVKLNFITTVKPESLKLITEETLVLPRIDLESSYPGQDIKTIEKIGALNYESYYRLSDEQRHTIPDIYHTNVDLTQQLPYQNLDDIIRTTNLTGFSPMPITNRFLGA
jgi:hypothetical protein